MTTEQGNQWKRVSGPNLQPQHDQNRKANEGVMNNDVFKNACEKVGIEPTKRQASKFRRKKGAAFKFGRN